VDYYHPARTQRLPRLVVAGLVVVSAAIAAVPGYRWVASSSSTADSAVDVPSSSSATASPSDAVRSEHLGAPAVEGVLPRRNDGALGEADGAVPDGTTVFNDGIPAVAKLAPALRAALRRAATDAARDRVAFVVNSGWRSPEYEDRLRREAVAKYGSERAAARWVATANTSSHVSGDAVDIGPSAATAWLSERGSRYGLCPIYRNEPWHYELRPTAIHDGCPRMYADPTHDPRMQK
jgi:hypothetical protein